MSLQRGKKLSIRENIISTARGTAGKFGMQGRSPSLNRLIVAVPAGTILVRHGSSILTFIRVVYHNSRMAMRRGHRGWLGALCSILCYGSWGCGLMRRQVCGTVRYNQQPRANHGRSMPGRTFEWFGLSSAQVYKV
jgi:hypothetical protein